jgi:hypothetical protein
MNTLGLAVFMPNCSFQVELDRDYIDEALEEIDATLNKSNIDQDNDERIFQVMQNALTISIALSNDELDSTTATTELAFSFLYAYKKQVGPVSLKTRGIIGLLSQEYVHFSSCTNASKFQEQVDKTRALHEEVMGDDLIDKTPPKPTLH